MTAGDVSAPERVKVVVGESGRPVAIYRGLPLLHGCALGEVVDAAAYNRVVAAMSVARIHLDHGDINRARLAMDEVKTPIPPAGEQSDRESMPREARQAAIRRAAETVRSGSGWVQRAGVQSTTDERAHLTTFTVEFWFSDASPRWSVRQQHPELDRRLRGKGDARSEAIDDAVRQLRIWAAEPWPEVQVSSPSTTETATGDQVERVARAMRALRFPDADWDFDPATEPDPENWPIVEDEREHWREMARVALAAAPATPETESEGTA